MKTKIKIRIASCVIWAVILSLFSPIFVFADEFRKIADIVQPIERKFLVTAYYSPVPGQAKYIRGSYKADLRLNGSGINSADGTKVYVGMLAAPPNYPFGTKIMIPGLGVGEVHDRGGAIQSKKDFDRIDVWMGRGEQGLKRALTWGIRFVSGVVYPSVGGKKQNLVLPRINEKLFVSWSKSKPKITVQKFEKNLKPGDKGGEVLRLKKKLKELNYYASEINEFYDKDLRQAILSFQLDNGIVASVYEIGAYFFGPRTRSKLNEEIIKKARREERIFSSIIPVGINKMSDKKDIKKLQELLKTLGYFNSEISSEYDDNTIFTVKQFQLDMGIIKSASEKGSGFFGVNTRRKLIASLNKKTEEINKISTTKRMKIAKIKRQTLFSKKALFAERESYPKTKKSIFNANLTAGSMGEEVKKLQAALKNMGYFRYHRITGYFGPLTMNAVRLFQAKYKIIARIDDIGAGVFGPKTRKVLNTIKRREKIRWRIAGN